MLYLSKAWGAQITAIHVIDTGHGVGYGNKHPGIRLERIQNEKRYGMDLLNEIDLLAKKEGIDIENKVLEKNDTVGKTIVEYAKINKADVI